MKVSEMAGHAALHVSISAREWIERREGGLDYNL